MVWWLLAWHFNLDSEVIGSILANESLNNLIEANNDELCLASWQDPLVVIALQVGGQQHQQGDLEPLDERITEKEWQSK